MKKVNFQIDGRMAYLEDGYYYDKIKSFFSYSSAGARFSPAFKLWLRTKDTDYPAGWDGKTSLFRNRSVSAGLLLSSVKELEKEGLRVKVSEWTHRPKLKLGKGFKDQSDQYHYQNKAVHAMISGIHEFGGGLILAATGSGKTKMAAQLSSWVKDDILFVVDQIPLLYQSQKEIQVWLKKEGYDGDVGVVGNSKFEPRRVSVATIQTLHKHRKKAKFRKWMRKIGIVIIDEIHKQMSRKNFDIITRIRPKGVIGLTATLQMKKKEIRMRVMNIAGPSLFEFPIEEGVKSGVLSKGLVVQLAIAANHRPRKRIKFKKKVREDGRIVLKKGIRPADDYEHNTLYNPDLDSVVKSIATRALKKGLAVAVLVERIRHLKKMNRLLSHMHPKLFYGAVKQSERIKSVKKFEKGSESLIIANNVFTKGVNIKRLNVSIDAAQRASKNDAMQKYGRLVRLHKSKDFAIFIIIHTMDSKCLKAAKSRKSAFRAAKIPVLQMAWSNSKNLFEAINKEAKRLGFVKDKS